MALQLPSQISSFLAQFRQFRLKISDQSNYLNIGCLVLEIYQLRYQTAVTDVQRPITDDPGVGNGILATDLVPVDQP